MISDLAAPNKMEEGTMGQPAARPFSIHGIHRKKHTFRAVFRSASLILLVGGFALYNALRPAPEDDPIGRSLQEEAECPALETVSTGVAVAMFIGILYMFLALAIVCDEFFVSALEVMASEHYMNLSMDVAGATLMAAGGSAPELFTSFVGTFQESDIGIGTIVGSAVFNVLFVIGVCSMLSKEVLQLTWWPLFRDCCYYAIGLTVLAVLVGVSSKGVVSWWEALILFAMYFGYVIIMKYNKQLYKKLTGKDLVLGSEMSQGSDNFEENAPPPSSAAEATTTPSADENAENGEVVATSTTQDADEVLSHDVEKVAHADFRWPGTFRAGVLKLLLHPSSWEERGGIGIVAKIAGDVEQVFKTVDLNGDGGIDRNELGQLFVKLGHEIKPEDLETVFTSLDLDNNGSISEEEFTKWYIKSEQRVLANVRTVFNEFDTDKNGSIDRDEVRALLKKLEPNVTESDVDDALKAMHKVGSTEEMTFEEFSNWYVHSIIYTKHQQEVEKKIEEDELGVCEALRPPKGEGLFAWFKYLLVLPIVAALTFTIPDVRRSGLAKWCYLSFFLSIIWIGVFSFFMVSWTELLGNTIGIPSVVMGLTLLAAGTSVPDLLSSVIVARMGEGDMAVSSSIGSNIFDILVGLPLPWLCYTLYPRTPDNVVIGAEGIWVSIFILIGMLVAIVIIIHCSGWKMTRTLGGCMFLLYFAYLAQAITVEYLRDPCFGK